MHAKHALWLTALFGGALTIVANLILLFAGRPFTGVPDTFTTLSPGPVVMWSVLGTIGATIAFALARRFAKSPNKTFVLIAVIVLLLSFIPDVLIHGMTSGMFAGATWSAVALLMVMHIAAAVILVKTLIVFTRPVVQTA